jgi:hypothetical protein
MPLTGYWHGNSWNIVQRTLGCSRSTISSAAKHASRTAMPTQSATLDGVAKKSVAIILWLLVENGSQLTRGKKAVREQITGMLLARFRGKRVNDTETRMVIQFTDDADLKTQIEDMLKGMSF